MLLTEITTIANNSTDENFSSTIVRDFFNEAIASINTTISAKLPYITTANTNDNYSALGEEWIRSVAIPYVCYLIKTNDGSLNEASSAFFQRYQVNLNQMKKLKTRAVKPEYRFWWEDASELDFKNANYRIEQKTGTDIPSDSFLPKAWNTTPGTVAAVYTDDLLTVSFYKVEGGTGVKPMGVIGSTNVGWFSSVSSTKDKSGIIGD
jgi:hypothetical protein